MWKRWCVLCSNGKCDKMWSCDSCFNGLWINKLDGDIVSILFHVNANFQEGKTKSTETEKCQSIENNFVGRE